MLSMEKIINRIVDIEMSARRIVDEAKERRDNLNATLQAELSEIKAWHDQQISVQLDAARAEETTKLRELVQETDEAQARQMAALERAAEANHDKWVDEIFNSIIRTDI